MMLYFVKLKVMVYCRITLFFSSFFSAVEVNETLRFVVRAISRREILAFAAMMLSMARSDSVRR